MDKSEQTAYVFLGFVIMLVIFCFFESDSQNTEAQIDCYESIAKDVCQDKGSEFYSLDNGLTGKDYLFHCIPGRDVNYQTFNFYDNEREKCDKLIVTTKKGFW